ncbi:efflux RND transporter periplasmic adaptor subunit [Hoeflea poritis]|uniref:Efflux RND transporter periplasmic adaptor subunit n=1 Tax=Hoeflea poritis TaxID=2993659 RepID=A0ABT4VJM2_9HYPH|nr:efflux RND transporter periplasmic adaptor subunit [Hoeflea poritis]MDA4844922.1 efflux RND transporter periplasmic adaptor subunit [Hoeflea poritis]
MTESGGTRPDTGSDGNERRPSTLQRWVWILVSIVVFSTVVVFLMSAEDTVDVEQVTTAPPLQQVSVEIRPMSEETAEITAFAEVRPRWSAQLRAAVSGRVRDVTQSALVGERVESGTTLVTIEDSRYVAELSAAELALKQSQLELRRAQNANTLAVKEHERNKVTPPNDLALRLPQLEIAKSAVSSAEARLAAASQQLDDATVDAPFSGFVTERFVSPGQTVNIGDPLVKLVDDRTFELTVEVSARDWALLRQPLAGMPADVRDQNGRTIAQATVRKAGGFLDETTRQYKVFLEIDEPEEGTVLSGDFVQVVLPGVTLPSVLNIAASALTKEGDVWFLDESDRLQRMKPRVLFRRGNRIIVETDTDADNWRVATTPLVSFLPGQKVRAVETGN